MNKLLALFLVLVIPLISWSQLDATIQLDSLKISYKTGGALDSVYRISLVYPNSFSNNNFANFQFVDASYFLNPSKGILFSNNHTDGRVSPEKIKNFVKMIINPHNTKDINMAMAYLFWVKIPKNNTKMI